MVRPARTVRGRAPRRVEHKPICRGMRATTGSRSPPPSWGCAAVPVGCVPRTARTALFTKVGWSYSALPWTGGFAVRLFDAPSLQLAGRGVKSSQAAGVSVMEPARQATTRPTKTGNGINGGSRCPCNSPSHPHKACEARGRGLCVGGRRREGGRLGRWSAGSIEVSDGVGKTISCQYQHERVGHGLSECDGEEGGRSRVTAIHLLLKPYFFRS